MNPLPRNARLVVEEARNDDNSTVSLSRSTMDQLEMFRGDTVLLTGKRQKKTVCIVLDADMACEPGKILMNKVVRKNLKVDIGDTISLCPCVDAHYGRRVHILPIDDTIQGIIGNLFDIFLKPYFMEAYRPVRKNDLFTCRAGMREVEFKVVEIEAGLVRGQPDEYCIVAPDTVIHCEGEPVKRADADPTSSGVGYDDIGGLGEQLAYVREVAELPLRHPQLFQTIGVTPPHGVLLTGPPGSGKTLIARALANEAGAEYFAAVNAGMAGELGDTLGSLNTIFSEAAKRTSAVIFIDEIDCIAYKREWAQSGHERSLTSLLLAAMDGFSRKASNVVVIGATNRPEVLDPAFCRCGRFDYVLDTVAGRRPDLELTKGSEGLSESARREILRVHMRPMKTHNDVDLEYLARQTAGFGGADLRALCREAAMQCIRLPIQAGILDVGSDDIDDGVLTGMAVSQAHFRHALDFYLAPSAPRVKAEDGVGRGSSGPSDDAASGSAKRRRS